MTPSEFRRAGHALVDWIADYRERLESSPVMSPAQPGEVRAGLPSSPPEEPEGFDEIVRDVGARLERGLTLWQHPRFFGYFPSNAELSSVLGDLLSTGLGVLGLSWQSSPALSELEEVVCDWMRQLLGLPESFEGVIADTASTSALVALLCARERASNFSMTQQGLQQRSDTLVVYTSKASHSSVEKAALLAGFGRSNVRSVDVDASQAMDAEALAREVQSDVDAGRVPCAIVATSGTTTTTAFDPLAAIASVAEKYSVWLHVDAAMAGSAMILEEMRPLWNGVERADSLVVNAHKWLGAAFDCSLYYVRDPQHLVRVMSTSPSYLSSAADGRVKNYRDWGIPLGRRFRALKLWFLIREQGAARLRARLRRDLANAKWLENAVRGEAEWKVLAPVRLQTVCVRHEPPGLLGESLDAHTLAWAERLNRSGFAYVTPATLEGRWMVRVSVGSIATERRHVEALFDAMKKVVRAGG